MATILPFLKPHDGSFGPDVTRVMGEAFDAARDELLRTGKSGIEFETVARRIIEAAKKGERDFRELHHIGVGKLHTTLRPIRVGEWWRVEIRWPNGTGHYFGKFGSERDATQWVDSHSWMTERVIEKAEIRIKRRHRPNDK